MMMYKLASQIIVNHLVIAPVRQAICGIINQAKFMQIAMSYWSRATPSTGRERDSETRRAVRHSMTCHVPEQLVEGWPGQQDF